MPTIHLDYLMSSAAIDILTLLAISICIAAEMHRDHSSHRRMATKRRHSLEA
jgi:hypothetical protein